jgi:hypothetical protein
MKFTEFWCLVDLQITAHPFRIIGASELSWIGAEP